MVWAAAAILVAGLGIGYHGWRARQSARALTVAWMPAPEDRVIVRDAGPTGADAPVLAGLEAYERHDLETAIRLLGAARSTDEMEIVRRIYLASACVLTGDPKAGLRALEGLRLDTLPEPWRGEALWTRYVALRRTGQGAVAEALRRELAARGDVIGRARVARPSPRPRCADVVRAASHFVATRVAALVCTIVAAPLGCSRTDLPRPTHEAWAREDAVRLAADRAARAALPDSAQRALLRADVAIARIDSLAVLPSRAALEPRANGSWKYDGGIWVPNIPMSPRAWRVWRRSKWRGATWRMGSSSRRKRWRCGAGRWARIIRSSPRHCPIWDACARARALGTGRSMPATPKRC
jgi:hypothetical protein